MGYNDGLTVLIMKLRLLKFIFSPDSELDGFFSFPILDVAFLSA